MKICFVAPANNYHTIKWATWFSNAGHSVDVVSFTRGEIPGVRVHYIDTGVSVNDSDSKKIAYLFHAKKIGEIVKKINPDIVNAHYATSYGACTALSGLKGYVLSVWGADIYDFPKKSVLHRLLLKYSLKKAGHIFSTSRAMADEAGKYTKKQIDVTPFGVDIDLFNPAKRDRTDGSEFIVGIVKTLEAKYGIDYLLEAAALVKRERPDIPLKVRIAGRGSKAEDYKKLAKESGLESVVTWLGFIPQEQAAREWANMDAAVVPSVLESESFGVSAIEAEASGTPLIISDIPGLLEATGGEKTCIVVPRKNSNAIACAIERLYDNKEERMRLSRVGRDFVCSTYELNACFRKVEALFRAYAGKTQKPAEL